MLILYYFVLGIPAVEALQKGLTDLQELFEHVLHTFKVCALKAFFQSVYIIVIMIDKVYCYYSDTGCVHIETAV